MSSEKSNIQWKYSGKPDFLLGTGATLAEQVLGWAASLLGAGLYGYLYLTHRLDWTWWQFVLAAFLAFDVVGGVVANSLNSCKRFYHSPAKPEEPGYTGLVKNHLIFSAFHVHTLLVALLYGGANYLFGIFWYIFLMVSTLVLLKTPLYLKRPAAFLAIALALLLNFYVIPVIPGFEWLAPALLIKIVYGHLVQEEPYRPLTEKDTP